MARARHEPDQNPGHREFITASAHQKVRAVMLPQEPAGLETA